MAKIHWIVYFIVGLFVSITSYFIDYNKLIFNLMKKEMNKTKIQKNFRQIQRKRLKRCRKCSNVMRITDRFCTRCGAEV